MDDSRAKISVSLSDDLKARLDAYAQDQGQSVSQVVQNALERFLSPSQPEPSPAPIPPPVEEPELYHRVRRLEDYVGQLAHHEEQLRRSLEYISRVSAMSGVTVPCPPPTMPPPWLPG